MGYAYLWEFIVAPEQTDEFERIYGQQGPWVALFRQSVGYVRTHLLRDQTNPGRFVTVDIWRTESDYREFRAAYEREYRELDRQCERLTTSEATLGSYDATDD